jgi:hypothetical protein
VRGHDLDIDYDHKQLTTEAAGWIQQAEARVDGLYLLVDWTKNAFTKIKERAFRYFSPEYVDRWKHPASGVEFSDVLFGGALTNRPFLKGIQPINLAEFSQSGTNEPSNGGNMNPRETLELMARLAGVEFTAETKDEDLEKAVTGKLAGSGGTSEKEPTPPTGEKQPTGEPEPGPQLTPAMASELKALAGENAVVAALVADRESLAKRVGTLVVSPRMSEVKRPQTESASERYALSPVVSQRLSEILVILPKELSDKLMDTLKLITGEGGLVRLGEYGAASGQSPAAKDAVTQFAGEIKKLMDADKNLSYADATEVVAANDPDLFQQYREASYIAVEA